MAITQQFSNAIKQYGFPNALYLVFTKIGEKLGYYHEVYTVFEQELNSAKTTRPLAAGFYSRELSMEDINQLTNTWVPQEQLHGFKNRLLKPGNIGLGIFVETTHELAYYFWLSFEKIEFPDYLDAFHTLQLGAAEAYLYDGYCHPDYRGNGFHGFAAVYLMNRAREAGKTNVITIIRSINRAAILSQEKVGFRPTKEIRFNGFKTRISSSVRNL
ncbi:hypothetical protein [Flavihumibacter sp. UBA7668]|uniref:hypothetical protein n=1 Tax=Flavihumibacter sp. UBA7668 TaxID=1946542 RepID=UPI0025BAC491|nr:hypothetical protein [Flavihumibacter sp. UBA7668]